MSDTRPPFDAADASWLGADVYIRPAHDAADATFMDDAPRVAMAGQVVTIPPSPPSVSVSGRAHGVQIASAQVVTIPPSPLSVSVLGRAHGVQIANALVVASQTVLPVAVSGTVEQALDLPDNSARRTHAAYRSQSDPTAIYLSVPHTQALLSQRRITASQQQAMPIQVGNRLAQTQTLRLRLAAMLEHEQGIRLSGSARLAQNEALRHREPVRMPQTSMLGYRASIATPHAEQIRTRTRRAIDQQQAVQTVHLIQTIEQQARTTQTRLCVSQQQMMWPLPGRWWPWYEPPSLELVIYCDPDYIARPLSCLVVLCSDVQPYCPGVDPPPPHGTIVIPIRRVYHVLNNVSLVRLSDNQPLDVERLSLSLSADAWTWSWSATMPGAMLDLIRVAGEPQELLATINGESIRLRIDSISRSRSFGASSLSVSGRGRAAVLASPAAPMLNFSNSEVRTAQQLLIDALTDNGVPIGWSVDWQIEDWSVPAGAWSLAGTYIDAAKRIAEAGGGYVQGHDTDPTLIIRAYYPVAPWDWPTTTPDIILPEDVCRTEAIEWREKVAYDAVWVTGNVGGRRDRIRRAGMSGDTQAPTVVDDLATDVIMTRQRGIRVLGDTGRQAWVSVSLPVIEETGLIRPGQLIRYSEQGNTHLGLSRSLSVECTFPAVWQTIQLETHP